MSNKQIIKKVFDESFDNKKMKQQIINKYERKENKMNKIMKFAIVPICIVLVTFVGITLNRSNNSFLEENIGITKVYAYAKLENDDVEKVELKDNIKLALANYNLAMSSVPGYPIEFDLDNLDCLKIEVINGTILDWNNETGVVKSLESIYQLSEKETLYFDINENTIIKIIGIKDKKEKVKKNITISMDDNFNYYAVIK